MRIGKLKKFCEGLGSKENLRKFGLYKLVPIICTILIVSVSFMGVLQSKIKELENPIEGTAQHNSEVLLQNDDFVADASNLISPVKEEDVPKDIEDNSTEESKENGKDDYKETNSSGNNPSKDNVEVGGGSSELGNIVQEEDKEGILNEYFTTTIVNNETVTDSMYRFSIKHLNKKLTVKNTMVIVGKDAVPNFAGRVSLNEGKNEITIKVTYENSKKEEINVSKKYEVYYQEQKIIIFTDLIDNYESEKSEINFYAYGEQKGKKVDIKVTCNEKNIKGNKDEYKADLEERRNKVKIYAYGEKSSEVQEFTVIYKPVEGIMVIHTDLANKAVSNSQFQFEAYAEYTVGQDSSIEVLNVKINDNQIPSSINTLYDVELVEGNNVISLSAEKDGKRAEAEYTIVYVKEEELEEPAPALKGTVTLSLEAGTIGLGYLVAPVQFTINIGEKASYVVDRFLKDYGIDYKSTGSLEHEFYLSRIYRGGVSTGAKIPDELQECFDRDGISVNYDHDENSLGEFDFAQKSGWMYSVNGIAPNIGFSGYNLQDGDVIRIRFTTWIGWDLGSGFNGTYGDW